MAEGGVDKKAANEHKLQGNKFLADGKLQDALEEYTMGISLDHENHVLYSNRSAVHAKMEDYAAALEDAELVIKLRPDWAKGYSRKGSALQFLGRFEEAKETFEKGLKIEPSNEPMKKGVKECEAEMEGPSASQPLGNPFANLETIMPRLKEDERTKHYAEDPSYMAMLKELGEDPMNMQKYLKDDRLRLTLSALLGFELEKPEDINYNEPPFVDDDDDDDDDLDEDFVESTDPEPAKISEITDPEPKTFPVTAEIAEMKLTDKEQAKKEKDLGTDYLKENNFEKAHEHYDAAIRCDPTDIAFYSNKALAFQRQKMPGKVREMSLKVIELGKEHGGEKKIIAKAYMRIGQTYFDEGKYDVALENFQRSIEEKDDPEAQKKILECRENISRHKGS